MLFRKRHKASVRDSEWGRAAETDHRSVPVVEEETAPADWREPESEEVVPEPSAEERPAHRRKGIRIGQFFTGGVLSQDEFTRRLPVIVYIVFLMLLYIANGFHIQHKHSELDRIADELKQLKTEAVTSSAVRMTLTRQSEIERLLRERNIPLKQGGSLLHVIKD